MSGNESHLITERPELAAYGLHQRVKIAAGKVGAADAAEGAGEQGAGA